MLLSVSAFRRGRPSPSVTPIILLGSLIQSPPHFSVIHFPQTLTAPTWLLSSAQEHILQMHGRPYRYLGVVQAMLTYRSSETESAPKAALIDVL